MKALSHLTDSELRAELNRREELRQNEKSREYNKTQEEFAIKIEELLNKLGWYKNGSIEIPNFIYTSPERDVFTFVMHWGYEGEFYVSPDSFTIKAVTVSGKILHAIMTNDGREAKDAFHKIPSATKQELKKKVNRINKLFRKYEADIVEDWVESH